MNIIQNLEQTGPIPPTALALGNFDGVHRGHQALIRACVEDAHRSGLAAAVFTFSNHPENVIAGRSVVKSILNFEEKAKILEDLGVDILFAPEFDDAVRCCSARDFCASLIAGAMRARHVFCGFNYSFGYMAEGTPQTLTSLGEELGFTVSVHDPVVVDGYTVSSTLLREMITRGRVADYERFAGRRYAIDGTVIEGERFGRRMGFPTANLALSDAMALPANGVYVTQTLSDGVWYPSVTNVGVKPTVGDFAKNAETHLFYFHNNIYGKPVRVEFIRMLREERRFDSAEALSIQINSDCRRAMEDHRKAGRIAENR